VNRADPFSGYSFLLRVIVYGVIPAFSVFQWFRLRRALHVFQLEGYKRHRFLQWCRDNSLRALFLQRITAKKPLVMTGRAWRVLVASEVLNVLLLLVPAGTAHLIGGWPFDVVTWAILTVVLFFLLPQLLIAGDAVVSPVQGAINNRYLRAAAGTLEGVAPLVIGVTGSFGKTSTKFAISGLIGPSETVLATPGSYNTPLGVCRTINENMKLSHRFFIVEMGAYGEGEIRELCEFVRPAIAVLTAIGPAHLERFGSMDAIKRGKYEIVTSLPGNGIAVMNVDDFNVRELADRTDDVRTVRYGLDAGGAPDVTAEGVRTTADGTSFSVVVADGSVDVKTRLLGRHAVGHILAGVAVALAAGRSLKELAGPISALAPVEHRLQIISGTGGVTVIDDAYNSNPDGAAAALEVLEQMSARRKVVVTPGIIELGPLQAEANERFGEHAGRVADTLIVVAPVNREAITRGARDGKAEVVTVDSLARAQDELSDRLQSGDVVLFENDLPDQYERR
jgi:UDP-N-acetylmuramoyl-tripeptide--D-alanyl-D-alanine ligase